MHTHAQLDILVEDLTAAMIAELVCVISLKASLPITRGRG